MSQTRIYLMAASFFVLTFVTFIAITTHRSLADEPPIHPRNSTWNSYTDHRQFQPAWAGNGAICPTCDMPPSSCLPGWRGKPYTDQVLGCQGCGNSKQYSGCCQTCWSQSAYLGCQASPGCNAVSKCGTVLNGQSGHWSIHWPRPFSNYWEDHFPGSCCQHACHHSGMGTRRSCGHFFDVLQPLSDIKLIESPRRDSGYCGPQCDPYGKLGASAYPRSVQSNSSSGDARSAGFSPAGDLRNQQANLQQASFQQARLQQVSFQSESPRFHAVSQVQNQAQPNLYWEMESKQPNVQNADLTTPRIQAQRSVNFPASRQPQSFNAASFPPSAMPFGMKSNRR